MNRNKIFDMTRFASFTAWLLLTLNLLSCINNDNNIPTWQKGFDLNTATGIEEGREGGFLVHSTNEIIKLDDRGEQLWSVNLEDEQEELSSLQITAVCVLRSGGYAIAGTGEANPGSGGKEVFLFFLDEGAGLETPKTLYTCNQFCRVSMNETAEGFRFLITGGSDEALKTLTAIVTDSSGNLVDQQSNVLANSENVLPGSSMVLGEDNGFVVDTHLRSITGNEETTRQLLRLDSALNIVWEFDYGDPEFNEIQNLITLSTGGFIVVGSSRGKGWMVKVDESGNPGWDKKFGSEDPGKRFLFDAIQNSRGQIIATGSNNINCEGNDDM